MIEVPYDAPSPGSFSGGSHGTPSGQAASESPIGRRVCSSRIRLRDASDQVCGGKPDCAGRHDRLGWFPHLLEVSADLRERNVDPIALQQQIDTSTAQRWASPRRRRRVADPGRDRFERSLRNDDENRSAAIRTCARGGPCRGKEGGRRWSLRRLGDAGKLGESELEP